MSEPVDDARRFLSARRELPQVNHILHGFPSVRMWPEASARVEAVREEVDDWYGDGPGPHDGYIGFPFCVATEPDRCGYCLFPSESFRRSSESSEYLELVRREQPIWRHDIGTPTSIFVGGGTPNLIRSDQLLELRQTIEARFGTTRDATVVTVEGIPQLFSDAKVAALAAFGVDRISMGAQQMDADLLAMSGRQETPAHIFAAIESARIHGLECNVDLIFGWPRQSIDSMVSGLEQLTATGVGHITHYEMNVGGPSDFALHRRHEMPGPETLRTMYRTAVELLTARGYRQLTTHDFVRVAGGPDDWQYRESWGTTARRSVVAAGFAGMSELYRPDMGAGWVTMNHRSLDRYRDAVDRGEPPIERWFRRSAEDVRLTALFRRLQGLEVDRGDYRRTFGSDVVDDHAPVWEVLAEEGWVDVDDHAVRLVGLGGYYVPLIQTLLARRRTQELQELLRSAPVQDEPGSLVELTRRRG